MSHATNFIVQQDEIDDDGIGPAAGLLSIYTKNCNKMASAPVTVSTNKLFIIFAGLCVTIGLINLNFSSTLLSVNNNVSIIRTLLLTRPKEVVRVERGKQSSSPTSSSFSVDILSVASIDTKRMELLNAQKRILTSHSSVRNFFNVTEVDDYDPTCYKDLTLEQVEAVSNFCRNRPPGLSHVMKFLRAQYTTKKWINKKKNPAGWLCAQPRPYSGLRKAYLHYKENRQELPDYFIVMDDDTYYNMETFQQVHKKINSTEQTVVAGCLVRSQIGPRQVNFTFPWGGFGSVISKKALEYLFHPIHCPAKGEESNHPNTEGICNQLSKNIVGELKYFENGNSLVDLIYKYVSLERYRDVAKWDWQNNGGFCMHSDWVMGYFVNYYNVSKHVEMKKFENVPHARIESFEGSDFYDKPSGYCKNEGRCNSGTMICHKESVEWMEKEVMKWKAQAMSGSSELSEELVDVGGGKVLKFCGRKQYRKVKMICRERVEYMTNRYHISEQEAKVGLLQNEDCLCEGAMNVK